MRFSWMNVVGGSRIENAMRRASLLLASCLLCAAQSILAADVAATVRQGDWVIGSTGSTSPAFMTRVNVRTVEVGWKQRGLAKANSIEADGMLVILDENGVLYLAEATPEELIIRSQTKLLDRNSWSVPTIVGRTLFVRDQGQIVAVDLG